MLFPNNTLQFNTISSINTAQRPPTLEGVAEVSKKYKKRFDFYPALLWIMSSAKATALPRNVHITSDASSFHYGTIANKGNRCAPLPPPLHRRAACPHTLQIFARAAALGRLSAHDAASFGARGLLPPVLDEGILIFGDDSTAYSPQHGLRTVGAGPQSLWNPDISANDWLLHVNPMPFVCRSPLPHKRTRRRPQA
jgi:hypothetical protein